MDPTSTDPVFDLEQTYLILDGGPGANTVPVGPDFWETIATRTDLAQGGTQHRPV